MSGKAKLEELTNTWYGFAVFSAICSILVRGIGFWSIGLAFFGLLFSWFFTFLIGRSLIKKSSLTRVLLICVSALFTVLGGLSAAKMSWSFMQTWELSVLATAAYSAAQAWIHLKSFRTLTDSSVKAYFS